MKKLLSLKWIVLGSVLGLTAACNCQKKEEQKEPQHMQPMQHDEEDDEEEREDGDMCELESTDPRTMAEEREETVPSPEVKAMPPVPAAKEEPMAQISESSQSTAAPAPVEKAVIEQPSSV